MKGKILVLVIATMFTVACTRDNPCFTSSDCNTATGEVCRSGQCASDTPTPPKRDSSARTDGGISTDAPRCIPTPEICNNGLDDDCDGKVDEECVKYDGRVTYREGSLPEAGRDSVLFDAGVEDADPCSWSFSVTWVFDTWLCVKLPSACLSSAKIVGSFNGWGYSTGTTPIFSTLGYCFDTASFVHTVSHRFTVRFDASSSGWAQYAAFCASSPYCYQNSSAQGGGFCLAFSKEKPDSPPLPWNPAYPAP